MIKMILILELIFRCEACYCIFANKAAEPYVFFADQTSPTSSAELVEPSKKFGVEKCWRNLLGYLRHFRTFFNWPRKLQDYKIQVIPIVPNIGDDSFHSVANDLT